MDNGTLFKKNILENIKLPINSAQQWLMGSDARVLVILILLAALTRLPLIFFPNSTIADEVTYANFATLVHYGIPFFDIHPPLVRIVFANILSAIEYTPKIFSFAIAQPYGDFPFTLLRFFVAIFGISLPPLLYLIGRLSQLSRPWALLGGLLVICDNALTLYGGSILPDTLLLFFNFAALACVLISTKIIKPRYSWLFVILGSVLWGLALSIKWTSLGMLPVFALLFLVMRDRSIFKLCAYTSLSIIVYISIFFYYFTLFSPTNNPIIFLSPVKYSSEIQDTRFPDPQQPMSIIKYIATSQQLMMSANESIYNDQRPKTPHPNTWPLGQHPIHYWWDEHMPNKNIYLIPNIVLWPLLFLVFLYALYALGKKLIFHPLDTWHDNQFIILFTVGYLVNYLPFFFIHRPMYLYHYFHSLLFLMLLTPHILPIVLQKISKLLRAPQIFTPLLAALLTLIGLMYLVFLPLTYGW
ncbi:MAG: hypothetical protein UY04_C0049G0011 [Parcubacteria group bacterium GW2011_GWA2_47_7]|nr:MAG: hypothetical protein UY04_C0049G0011 [Parcubacteria group bacterium GW2011_GWA2_47_7]